MTSHRIRFPWLQSSRNPSRDSESCPVTTSYGRTTSDLRINPSIVMDLIRIILSVIIPPLGVFFQVGIGGAFWLNILLTILGYIPGLIHAIWIIAKK
jgi:uncharacterized membrane protein YqaE (UPF0057 family)